MKKLFLIGLVAYSCNLLPTKNYSPKNPGNKWIYKMSNESFEDLITNQKLVRHQKEYFQSIRKYSWGAADTSYFRTDKNGTVLYFDIASGKESIEVPSNPKLFYKWISSDNAWEYEIVNMHGTLTTPSRTFKNCLVIKAKQILNRDEEKLQTYFNYYSDNIGYVGSKVGDDLIAYLEEWHLE